MIVRPTLPVYKNPPIVRCFAAPILQQRNERFWHWYGTAFMALGSETDIIFLADVVFPFAPIDVLPRRERDFLFPATCPKEKLITHGFFRIHRGEQFL